MTTAKIGGVVSQKGDFGLWTREGICGAYIVVSVAIAMLLPPDFTVEKHVGFDVSTLPWLHVMMPMPERLPSLTGYFLLMWLLFPVFSTLICILPSRTVSYMVGPDRYAPMRTVSFAFALWACIALFAYAMYGLSMSRPSDERGYLMFRMISQYRIFMGLGGGALMMSTGLLFCMAALHVTLIWRSE